MFELRLQDAGTTQAGEIEGLPIGRFGTYDEAVDGLEAEHARLAAQLVANGEGGVGMQFHMAVVAVDHDTEMGLLWSSYQPHVEPSQ